MPSVFVRTSVEFRQLLILLWYDVYRIQVQRFAYSSANCRYFSII